MNEVQPFRLHFGDFSHILKVTHFYGIMEQFTHIELNVLLYYLFLLY